MRACVFQSEQYGILKNQHRSEEPRTLQTENRDVHIEELLPERAPVQSLPLIKNYRPSSNRDLCNFSGYEIRRSWPKRDGFSPKIYIKVSDDQPVVRDRNDLERAAGQGPPVRRAKKSSRRNKKGSSTHKPRWRVTWEWNMSDDESGFLNKDQ